MFSTYLRFTFRNLTRNKMYTLINVGGLAFGMVSALIIFLIIRFETSFDRYHDGVDRIYRVVTRVDDPQDKVRYREGVPFPLPDALRTDFPELQDVTVVDANFLPSVISFVREDGSLAKFVTPPGMAYVEPDYFKIFSYHWLQGDPQALLQPGAAVLSIKLAKQFFGEQNPIGRRLTFDGKETVQVTGLVADVPANTDVPFNLLVHFNRDERGNDNWGSTASAVQCYVKLPLSLGPESVRERLPRFVQKYRDEKDAARTHLDLQPLREVHLDTRFGNFTGRSISRANLAGLALVAFFLLATACINFVNLNTALAVRRAKEVGIRKVMGGSRGQLGFSFMAETALITLLAVLAALTLTEAALPPLSTFFGYHLNLHVSDGLGLFGFLLALFALVTLAAGLYPAAYLSRFNPIETLRGKAAARYGDGLRLRKGLVVLQFAVSQALIIGTLVVTSQMRYVRQVDMGFDKEGVIEVVLPVQDDDRLQRFKQALTQAPAIRSVAFSNSGTASGSVWKGTYQFYDSDEIREGTTEMKFVDPDFLATYGVRLLAGVGLAGSDTLQRFLVNRAFAETAGYGAEPARLLGKRIKLWGREAPIAGVVADFNTRSLHEKVEPVVMMFQNRFWMAGIRVDLRQVSGALEEIEQAWSATFPEYIFNYGFLDDNIAEFYEDDLKAARLLNLATGVAIFIGCLGLFGLVSYMATMRTKEFGVRKVLGAGAGNILALLSHEFGLLLLLAFVVAAPVAHYLMSRWLAGFAYHVQPGLAVFVPALLLSALISLATVAYRALRAAATNPVVALRNE